MTGECDRFVGSVILQAYMVKTLHYLLNALLNANNAPAPKARSILPFHTVDTNAIFYPIFCYIIKIIILFQIRFIILSS